MDDELFWILTAAYAVVAIKVDQWFTISRLGFKTETPQLFLTNPKAYHWVRMLLLAASVAALFFSSTVLWYWGAAVLGALWLGAFWIGRKMAFRAYRRIHREMSEYEESLKGSDSSEYEGVVSGEDPATRRAELEKGAHMTDQELVERVERSLKWGI